MPLFTLGLNHQTAPLAIRERVAFGSEAVPAALQAVRRLPGVDEAAILSTCNRTEIFTVGSGRDSVLRWLCESRQLPHTELSGHLYQYGREQTVQHAIRVATGLDSMILGEPQILGQMKQAYRLAQDAQSLGPILSRLFQHVFRVAKKVRTDTEIGARSVSVAGAAARLTSQVFASLRGKDVLIVGAGETARLIGDHLYGLGEPRITVANRTPQRAAALAGRYSGAACGLDGIAQQLGAADVVVTSVDTTTRLIDLAMVRDAFAQRRRKAVLMIDLGVPRNIDPDVADNEDIYLYSVDDLRQLTEDNQRSRAQAASEAEVLIEAGTDEFLQWLDSRAASTALVSLRMQTSVSAEQLTAQARQRIAKGQDPAEVTEWLAHKLTQKFLHAPSVALRDAPPAERADMLRHLQRLFDLDIHE